MATKEIKDAVRILNGEKCRVGDLCPEVRTSIEGLYHDLGAEALNDDDIIYFDKKKRAWGLDKMMRHTRPRNFFKITFV